MARNEGQKLENEEDTKRFWGAIKDNDYWSGSIVGLEWEELWQEAREEIQRIYLAAKGRGNDKE